MTSYFGHGETIHHSCIDVQYFCFRALRVAWRENPDKGLQMARVQRTWMPPVGAVVVYAARNCQLTRNVRVLAEASGGRMVVEAIGRQGVCVRLTVKRENLRPMEPDLFS